MNTTIGGHSFYIDINGNRIIDHRLDELRDNARERLYEDRREEERTAATNQEAQRNLQRKKGEEEKEREDEKSSQKRDEIQVNKEEPTYEYIGYDFYREPEPEPESDEKDKDEGKYPDGLEKYFPDLKEHFSDPEKASPEDIEKAINWSTDYAGFFREKAPEMCSRSHEEREAMYAKLTAERSKEYVHYGMSEYDPERVNPKNDAMNKPDHVYWASPSDSQHGWKDFVRGDPSNAETWTTGDEVATYFKISEESRVLVIENPSDLYYLPWQWSSNSIDNLNCVIDYETLARDGISAIEIRSDAITFNSPVRYFDIETAIVLNPKAVEIDREKGMYLHRNAEKEQERPMEEKSRSNDSRSHTESRENDTTDRKVYGSNGREISFNTQDTKSVYSMIRDRVSYFAGRDSYNPVQSENVQERSEHTHFSRSDAAGRLVTSTGDIYIGQNYSGRDSQYISVDTKQEPDLYARLEQSCREAMDNVRAILEMREQDGHYSLRDEEPEIELSHENEHEKDMPEL